MPKLVDHDERRRAIVAAAWRVIATRGIDGTNMRDLAREAGYANGALSHYFSGKDEILRAAYDHVFTATNDRVARAVGDDTGLVALRKFCQEVMPLTSETLLEARIAVSLWQRGLNDEHMAQTNQRALAEWRLAIADYLRQARDEGTVVDLDVAVAAEALMTTLVGMQVTGALDPDAATPASMIAVLDAILASWAR